jgi:hypothetical protein
MTANKSLDGSLIKFNLNYSIGSIYNLNMTSSQSCVKRFLFLSFLLLLVMMVFLWTPFINYISESEWPLFIFKSHLSENEKPISQRLLQFTGNFNGGNDFMNGGLNSFNDPGSAVFTGPISSAQNFGSQSNDDVFTGPFTSGLNQTNNFTNSNDDVFTGPVTSGQNQNSFQRNMDIFNETLGIIDFGQSNSFSNTSGISNSEKMFFDLLFLIEHNGILA